MLYYDRIDVSEKKVMLIRQANQNSAIFATIGIFK